MYLFFTFSLGSNKYENVYYPLICHLADGLKLVYKTEKLTFIDLLEYFSKHTLQQTPVKEAPEAIKKWHFIDHYYEYITLLNFNEINLFVIYVRPSFICLMIAYSLARTVKYYIPFMLYLYNVQCTAWKMAIYRVRLPKRRNDFANSAMLVLQC